MNRTVKHWELRRETQDAIVVQDTHGTHSEVALRVNGVVLYDYPEIIPAYVKKAVVKMFEVNYDQLVGFYYGHGYNVWRQIDGKLTGDEPLYDAGNSRGDSQSMVSVEDGEDLDTLKRYCNQTGTEMAEELGIPWGGCSQEDDPWEEVF